MLLPIETVNASTAETTNTFLFETDCEQLQENVENAYIAAGAGEYEAIFAGYAAWADCISKKPIEDPGTQE